MILLAYEQDIYNLFSLNSLIMMILQNMIKKKVKIVSWNVNSINVRLKSLLKLIKKTNPDIILLQELKCSRENFPYESFKTLGYNVELNCTKGFNGVAIVSKYSISNIKTILDEQDTQARYLEATLIINYRMFTVVCIYAPHASNDLRMKHKLFFMNCLIKRLKILRSLKKDIIVAGDFNIDPYKPVSKSKICCSLKEKNSFQKILNLGFVNVFAELNKVEQSSDILQLDHFLVSKKCITYVRKFTDYAIGKKENKKTKHNPIIVLFNIKPPRNYVNLQISDTSTYTINSDSSSETENLINQVVNDSVDNKMDPTYGLDANIVLNQLLNKLKLIPNKLDVPIEMITFVKNLLPNTAWSLINTNISDNNIERHINSFINNLIINNNEEFEAFIHYRTALTTHNTFCVSGLDYSNPELFNKFYWTKFKIYRLTIKVNFDNKHLII